MNCQLEINTSKEKTLFNASKNSRYYLVTWGIILLGILGLLRYMVIWPTCLPNFMVNNHIIFLMKLSGIILSLILVYLIFVSFRESRGLIILTDKKLILTNVKPQNPLIIPLGHITKISLGSSPLEKLCRCASIWLTLKESEPGYLVGPLSPDQAKQLTDLLANLTGKSKS
ncbi:MAG: hypothetical protein GX295_01740 [Syntrophomonadaceae bacterium]|nr:hypothetical protein [Syntrophomonadaceae bacterium]